MISRLSETSRTLIYALQTDYEVIRNFIKNNKEKASSEQIYAAYTACVSCRHVIACSKTNDTTLDIKSDFENKLNVMSHKIEACEKIFESHYADEMVFIKSRYEIINRGGSNYLESKYLESFESIKQDVIEMHKANGYPRYAIIQFEQKDSFDQAAEYIQLVFNYIEENKLYIHLQFKYDTFKAGAEVGGAVARMLDKPKILDSLPNGAIPDKFSKKLKATLFENTVAAGFIHDCGNMSKEKAEEALHLFSEHYNHYKDGMPATCIDSIKPKNNEIISNLITAINNASLPLFQRQPLLKNASANDFDVCISRYTY